jgi:hypothetical protein
MKEVFEKIIDTLRTESGYAKHCFDFKTASAFNAAITIVNVVFDDMDKGKVSDGYHTFNELYHHRAVLFAVICNTHKELAWKSKLHDTGDMYDGMFIVGIETPEGEATYHYDIDPYWDMFNVKELQNAPKWDGHTPDEAIRRIGLLGKDINVSTNVSEKLTGSDDFCEWTGTGISDNWKPSCEPNSTYNVFGVAWFRRCPYCGKKIKVVE